MSPLSPVQPEDDYLSEEEEEATMTLMMPQKRKVQAKLEVTFIRAEEITTG